MTRKRIIVDASAENFFQEFQCQMLLSSSKYLWNNINFTLAHLSGEETPDRLCFQPVITIPTTPTRVEFIVKGKMAHETDKKIGVINFDPSNTPRRFIHKQSAEGIKITVDPLLVKNVEPDSVNPDTIELVQSYKREYPLLFQIGYALKKEVESESPFHVYVETLASCIAAHPLRNYSSRNHSWRKDEGGLATHKLKLVIEYINDNLSEGISLKMLANLIGISQYHFSRLFKQSMGLSPYKYIIQQRINRAKNLLLQGDMSIAEIALVCGFTHQSHLNRHFKRFTGATPKKFLNP